MKHGSLFSGIGGFDLAAQWMGWENVFQVEKDQFCQKVLAKNFPQTKRYGEIKEFDGTQYRGSIDVLSGGFPCQPYSVAGKRKGNKDDRHLWPEYYRIIGEIRPIIAVGENVFGLINWENGLVFQQIKTDLENIGYQVVSFVLPACGVNAPHKRDRVWIIAYSGGYGYEWRGFDEDRRQAITCKKEGNKWEWVRPNTCGISSTWAASNANCAGLQRSSIIGGIGGIGQNSRQQPTGHICTDWQEFPTTPPVCGRNDGIPHRVDRIKALGNAIVPQIALQIFKAIESYDQTINRARP